MREHTTEAFLDSLNTWIPAPSPTVLTPGLTGTLRPSSWFSFSFPCPCGLAFPPSSTRLSPQFYPLSPPCPFLSSSLTSFTGPLLISLPRDHGCLHSFSSVQFSCSVVYDSLRPRGLQLARPPCPSLSPGACSNSCPSSR